MKKDVQTNNRQNKKLNPLLKGQTCPICMEAPTTWQINSCSHGFCQECILRWSERKNNCPICRRRFRILRSGNRRIKIDPPTFHLNNNPDPMMMNPFSMPILMIPIFPLSYFAWNMTVPSNEETVIQQTQQDPTNS